MTDTPAPLPPVSDADIADLASSPTLLVALDVDGTLADFSPDPLSVRLVPGSDRAVRQLCRMPGTTVMLLSGRDLRQLRIITGFEPLEFPGPDDVRLVGSHGAEPAEKDADADGSPDMLTPAQVALLERITAVAEEQASRDEGLWVEYKPYSRGLHRRTAVDAAEGLAATEALRAAVQDLPGVTLTVGKAILEVAVTDMTKGRYLQWYTEATRPDRVVFIGDDLTDETALRVLRPGDVGVKVGDGETAAIRRVAGTAEVADVLRRLTDARSLHNADRDAPAQS